MGAWLALSAQAAKPVEQRSGRQESAEKANQRPADNREIAASLGRLVSAVEAKNNDPYAKEDRQRAKDDLTAQQEMARWTQVMGWAGVAAVILSTIGIYLIYVTFKQTQRAAGAAEQTYRAFVAAEDAAISVEFGGTPMLVTLNGEAHEEFLLHPAIVNDGRSAAHIQHCSFAGEDIPVDYTVEPGKKFGLPEPIGLDSPNAFEFAVRYSTPLRPIAVLTVTVEPRKSPNNAGKARGTIVGRKIEFPEEKSGNQS